MPFEVMENEPRYKIEQLVEEIAGRRDEVICALSEPLKAMVLGIVDQIAALRKHNPDVALRGIRFEDVKWTRDGKITIAVSLNGRPFSPGVARWD